MVHCCFRWIKLLTQVLPVSSVYLGPLSIQWQKKNTHTHTRMSDHITSKITEAFVAQANDRRKIALCTQEVSLRSNSLKQISQIHISPMKMKQIMSEMGIHMMNESLVNWVRKINHSVTCLNRSIMNKCFGINLCVYFWKLSSYTTKY